jgi:hypothetical protein
MMTLGLADDQGAVLVRLLQRTIDDDRYPQSPRLAPLKPILAKPWPRTTEVARPPLVV